MAFFPSGDDITMHVFRGKTLAFEIIWGGAQPIDITGFTAVLQARDRHGALMLDLTTDNGGIAVDGPNGRLFVSGTPAVTSAVTAPGVYELEMTTGTDEIYRVISGLVVPIEEVVQ
ncbi:hypothetical protein [Amorphus suaedae]